MKYKITDLFELKMGKTPSRSNPNYWNGTNVWLSVSDLSSSGKYISCSKERITEQAIDESKIQMIPKDTVVMSFKLSLGKVSITTHNMYTNEAIIAFVDKKSEKVDPSYLYYWCLSQNWEKYGNKAVMGVTLNKKTLTSLSIELPPYELQKRIVKRLDLLANLLEAKNIQLQSLQQLVQSRFIEMFGDTNNSMEWPIANVESIAKVKVGLVIKPTRFYSSSPTRYKAIRGLNISPFCINDTNWVYFTEDGAKSNKKTEVKENDVVVVRSGAPGTAAVVTKEYAGSNAIDVLIVEPDLTQIDPTYLCAYTNFPHGLKQISKGSGGAAQKHFNVEKYKNLTIFIPPLEKQKLFSIEKKEIDKSKLAIQKSIDELETLKKKLMQEYFG
ncbi:restriction endonuclease subunit S [Faecalibaculum rodentium]|uniref:restriction endonuclease subunit S n=17 Tax=Faecalibaculum rodentium TaxID=1702221 RepID=UPI002491FCCC|nr:restriction endonuclease subunit S [Faecalibaculum rodentium]